MYIAVQQRTEELYKLWCKLSCELIVGVYIAVQQRLEEYKLRCVLVGCI